MSQSTHYPCNLAALTAYTHLPVVLRHCDNCRTQYTSIYRTCRQQDHFLVTPFRYPKMTDVLPF